MKHSEMAGGFSKVLGNAAAEAILDRAWGRPTQAIDHGVSNDQEFKFTIDVGGPK